ncbi:Gfo/Idh/MocA family protein [Umezawaea endophytica]|uniref:Gfo/Idh/MocA family oxidoreductase n=1 Tax=Umezawaea endophytica TaxID=1654476 RepID=A0A9X2VHQ8_9PSEU|nr:Gfo/Idh/MocA family oxidoreductase [Umezawaea endophytica]MCS7476856.1 Gfo/Idh/MocA family oxidoreductase [Umezawaea endophytica]
MRLEIGLIGATGIAERAVVRPSAGVEGISVRAVAARDPLRAAEFAARNRIPLVHGNYDDLLADPGVDAVYLSLHNSAHHPWILRAARAGKHVIVEKPLCLDTDELAEIQDLGDGVRVVEAVPTAGHPWQAALREMIADRRHGDLRTVHSELTFGAPKPGGYRDLPELGGGIFYDTASYWLQAIQATVGLTGATGTGESAFDGPNGVDRSFRAGLSWPDGRMARLRCRVGERHVATHEFVFDRATATLRNFLLPVRGAVPLNLVVRRADGAREVIGFPASSYYTEQLKAVGRWLTGGPPWGGELPAAAERIAVMTAVHRSARRTGLQEAR